MNVWKKARLVKGWQNIRGAKRNRKEKAGKRKMYEMRTARGRKKTYTSGTQVNFYKRRMVKTRGRDNVANGGGNGK